MALLFTPCAGLAVCQGWRFAFMVAAHPEARFTSRLLLSLLWALPISLAASGAPHP